MAAGLILIAIACYYSNGDLFAADNKAICLLMMGAAMEMMALLLVSPLAAFLLGLLPPATPHTPPQRALPNFQPAACYHCDAHLGARQDAHCPFMMIRRLRLCAHDRIQTKRARAHTHAHGGSILHSALKISVQFFFLD